jgi:hypothetical protein
MNNNSPNAEIIRLFYELWEGTLPGREYVLSMTEMPDALDRLARSNAADVNRTLRYLNRIGHLIARGPLDSEFVSSLVGKEAIRTITRLQPLLTDAREKRSDPEFLEYIDHLLTVCRRAYPDYEPQYPTEERRGVGLIS